MSANPEQERIDPILPIDHYFKRLGSMGDNPGNRMIAIDELAVFATGKSAEEEDLERLAYEPDGMTPASEIRMLTYPIVIYGEDLEKRYEPADVVAVYSETLAKIMEKTAGVHDEECPLERGCPVQSVEEGEFCPVIECVDFLVGEIEHVDFDDPQIAPDEHYMRTYMRMSGLMCAGGDFPDYFRKAYDNYLERFHKSNYLGLVARELLRLENDD